MAYRIMRTTSTGVENSAGAIPGNYFGRVSRDGFSLRQIYFSQVQSANALRIGIGTSDEKTATRNARRGLVEKFPKLKKVRYKMESDGTVQIYYYGKKFPQEFGNQDIKFPCARRLR